MHHRPARGPHLLCDLWRRLSLHWSVAPLSAHWLRHVAHLHRRVHLTLRGHVLLLLHVRNSWSWRHVRAALSRASAHHHATWRLQMTTDWLLMHVDRHAWL